MIVNSLVKFIITKWYYLAFWLITNKKRHFPIATKNLLWQLF